MKLHRVALLVGLLLFAAGPLLAADWGTIKGQVIWGGATIPERSRYSHAASPAPTWFARPCYIHRPTNRPAVAALSRHH